MDRVKRDMKRQFHSEKIKGVLKKNICTGLALFLLIMTGQGCACFQQTTRIYPGETFYFPKEFLWGASTSSHQVEGYNTNNNWWRWEKKLTPDMRSGEACDEWNRFEEDFELAKSMGLTAFRFSLEWSRIETSRGNFDESALERYRDMIVSLRSKGMEPIVTLNHFTIPIWFADQGGWLSGESPELFSNYVEKVTGVLGADVHYWITLNEPATYIYKSYMLGEWPPGAQSTKQAFQVIRNLALAHVLAYVKIKGVYADKEWEEPLVGIAQQVLIFAPRSAFSLWDRISAGIRDKMINHLFVEALIKGKASVVGFSSLRLPIDETLDFIGLNYYMRERVHSRGFLLQDILAQEVDMEDTSVRRNSLGWEIYPEGLYKLLKAFEKYKLPILISENGICTNDDAERSEFIVDHLKAVARAMNEGVPVIGYLYWSLLDNYEWAEGYAPRFGLIEVDYETQKRTIRDSAKEYGEIITSGKISY